MTAEEITHRTCSYCEGLGEVDPTDTVDENDLEVVLKELRNSVADGGQYGLNSPRRGMRVRAASRIVWLANRVIWLENCETVKAEDDARYAALHGTAEPA